MPNLVRKSKHDNTKKNQKSPSYRYVEANHYHRRIRDPKNMLPNGDKMKNGKFLFQLQNLFFQQFFQPVWPRREQEGNGWHCWTRHCYRMAVGIHRFVQLHDMSEWRAREISENCCYF